MKKKEIRKIHGCPYCGKKNNRLFELLNREDFSNLPEENDISLCSACYGIAQFDKDLRLTKISVKDLPADIVRELASTILAIQAFKDMGKEGK